MFGFSKFTGISNFRYLLLKEMELVPTYYAKIQVVFEGRTAGGWWWNHQGFTDSVIRIRPVLLCTYNFS
jgi:hypothetical protein